MAAMTAKRRAAIKKWQAAGAAKRKRNRKLFSSAKQRALIARKHGLKVISDRLTNTKARKGMSSVRIKKMERAGATLSLRIRQG